jgi:hypothetical protein
MTLIDDLNHIDQAIATYREKLIYAKKQRDRCLPWSQAQWDADAWVIHYENEIEELERAYTSVALGEIGV